MKNKIILVTGGSSGIGKAICEEFERKGAVVVSASRREEENLLFPPYSINIDVTNSKSVSTGIGKVIKKFKKIDVLINNSGIFKMGESLSFAEKDWDKVLETNLKGCFLMSRGVFPYMKENQFGKIINIGSLLSHSAFPNRAAYGASKTGVLGLTRTLAIEWIKDGIYVNSISPGMIDIGREHPSKSVTESKILSRIPIKRLGKPKDIAKVALFLASEDSNYIVGEDIRVDGGWLSNGYFE
ncbi:3-oxoacyl-ACP reductase [Streptococcus pneumoniae]|uniref:SDR family NAD(P)-dependent oxidoreductase n=1 Tax=Streptococcus pneumoniae TaxID=1313 RepID=UPI0008275BAE|nr:SDR family oxidoreductase [Streptococcus pneumoniae]MDS2642208.1 SDR family oxidoreductase [Streptococcus pneumoniae]MDS2795112.1 SDR family oxidoreductase [Streptococcus pneumoniae]MDS2981449.1 SDR family oxidoreductase [Streptococcus pneumoniae]MDS3087142.1 SDR family oxidoreductase [Streptococcus pneumoniae]MDS3196830.1 SDR family oxidoreductase [Streptococcus pneumoniae]